MRDLDNAILNFRSYINVESHAPEVYFDLAVCLKLKDNIIESIKNFSLAIDNNPKYEIAYFERGLLKQKNDDIDGACADLKKALALGYNEALDYFNDICKNRKA
jgi:tetratricopeptide (TPR) repeat protein